MNADTYQHKYRVATARLATWDYSSNAAYFVTICTEQRICAFGAVLDGAVALTPLGQAATECWHAIPEHFPFVVLGESVIMPNHLHGTIMIDKSLPHEGAAPIGLETQIVETQNLASLRQPKSRFGPQSQNLASIVRGFKIGVTKFARQNKIPFAWQSRYHDHIIRDAADYERIRKYIAENPLRWADDQYYTTP